MKAYRAAEKALREYRHERAVPVLAVVAYLIESLVLVMMNRRAV